MNLLLHFATALALNLNAHAAEVCVIPIVNQKPPLNIDRCFCDGMEVKDAQIEGGQLKFFTANRLWAREWSVDVNAPAFGWKTLSAERLADRARTEPNLQICCGYYTRDSNTCVQIGLREIPRWDTLSGGPAVWPGRAPVDVGTAGQNLNR